MGERHAKRPGIRKQKAKSILHSMQKRHLKPKKKHTVCEKKEKTKEKWILHHRKWILHHNMDTTP